MKLGIKALLGLVALAGLPEAAAAAPYTAYSKDSLGVRSAAENVHYRRYRHCHWRDGERWCHGGRHYGDRSGIYLNLDLGGRRHHRDHDGRHSRDRDHDRR